MKRQWSRVNRKFNSGTKAVLKVGGVSVELNYAVPDFCPSQDPVDFQFSSDLIGP